MNKGFENYRVMVTQGFIGSDHNQISTTLGREGSDYSAGIFAYALDAQEVVIWKDVPGMRNADPKYFENNQIIEASKIEDSSSVKGNKPDGQANDSSSSDGNLEVAGGDVMYYDFNTNK